MTNEEIIEQLENTIGLIKQNGKDWLDDRDIPILEACIKSLTALDKIKAEIKEWYWQADKQALAKDPCVVDAMIDLFIRTIDKYRKEQTDADSD